MGSAVHTILRRVYTILQVSNQVDIAGQNLAGRNRKMHGWETHCTLHGVYPRAREPLSAFARNKLQDLTEAVTRSLRGCSETRRRCCAVPGGGGGGGGGVVVLNALSRRQVSLEMGRSQETERIAVSQVVKIGRDEVEKRESETRGEEDRDSKEKTCHESK